MGRYVIDVRDRVPDGALDPTLTAAGRVQVFSILTVSLPDDAALHGLLHRIQGLALTLVSFHRIPAPGRQDIGSGAVLPVPAPAAINVRLMVQGGLGDLAIESLRDVCTPHSVDARLVVDGSQTVGDVLTRLSQRGLAVLGVNGPAADAEPDMRVAW